MKNIILLNYLLIINCYLAFAQPGGNYCFSRVTMPYNNGSCFTNDWVLVFEDNFNGNQINRDIWSTRSFDGKAGNGDVYYTDGNNYEFNNGILKLVLKNEPVFERKIPYLPDDAILDDGLPNKRYFPYTAGMITSKETFDYFIAEIRFKLPSGSNAYPAFWFFGGEHGSEIDVFEFQDGNTTDNSMSVHNYFAADDPEWTYYGDTSHLRCTYGIDEYDFSSRYYTYAVYWDKYVIAWFVDDDLVLLHPKWRYIGDGSPVYCSNLQAYYQYVLNGTFPRDPMYLIVTTGNKYLTTSPMPNKTEIDYIKVWQPYAQCQNKYITNIGYEPNDIYATSIVFDGNSHITAGSTRNIYAQNQISIKDYFKIDNGSTVRISKKPDLCNNINFKSAGIDNERPNKYLSIIRNYFIKQDSLNNKWHEISNAPVDKSLQREEKLLIEVYPNPNRGKLNIKLNIPEDVRNIKIYNLMGESIYEMNSIHADILPVDLSGHPKGIYTIKTETNDNIFVNKILIE